MLDIYFESDYGILNEKIEMGVKEIFEFSNSCGSVRHMFIKREIPFRLNGITYFDIITPYGYGGPLVLPKEREQKDALVKDFMMAFAQYCQMKNIVSEFVRFHPVTKNALGFEDYYSLEHVRNTVGTNLRDYNDPIDYEFSKSCRKTIRNAIKKGVGYKITTHPQDLKDFKYIYFSTMNRNQADKFYYFNEDYFDKCIELFGNNIVLVEAIYKEQTIAMGLYFVYGKTIHVHLSGTLSDFLYLSPAYVLRYAITIWGKEQGYELIHHGGGRNSAPDDGLYLFKKQFGKNTEFKFFIGKKVWNHDIYQKLCKALRTNTEFFPAYRSRE